MCKMYEIKDIKEIEEKNQKIVNDAKQRLNDGFLKESKELFEMSLEICKQQNWEGGINYSIKTIKEIDKRLNPLKELTEAGIVQSIGMPQVAGGSGSAVMVNLGTEDNPFHVTDIEHEYMKKFESETGKNAFYRGKITQNYLKWKSLYEDAFGEL